MPEPAWDATDLEPLDDFDATEIVSDWSATELGE